jgi:hypothetical protein
MTLRRADATKPRPDEPDGASRGGHGVRRRTQFGIVVWSESVVTVPNSVNAMR